MSVLTRLRKKFPVLTPPAKKRDARVEIARELISVLQIGRMKATLGYGYFDMSGGTPAQGVDESYEAIALSMRVRGKTTCKVCAIGAACLVAVGLYDEADTLEQEYDLRVSVDSDTMRDVLARWFTRKQLDLIECAYEGSDGYDEGGSSVSNRTRAVWFGQIYFGPRERLEAIMGNIIDNNGTFKP